MTIEDIEHIYEKSCLSKTNLSEEHANRIIDKALKDRNLLLYYYKCKFCNSHHLTSNEPHEIAKLNIV